MTKMHRDGRTAAWLAPVAGLVLTCVAQTALAGATVKIDDTKWLSLGAGARADFRTAEDSAPNGDWSDDFNLNSARLYLNGQIHKYIKFEFNTECVFCGNSALEEWVVLDAIGKFEYSPAFNVWAGRLLVPAERQELNGPYYSTTWDAYKTPFTPSDFSTNFGTGGAGVYARDHGVNVWGAIAPEGRLQYVFGVFNGLESSTGFGPNQDDNLMWAGRVAYNFLGVEKNPGYYTSGTYYGGAGDIFTIGLAAQYQEDGSGSFLNPGDYFGFSADLLYEGVLESKHVVTLNGEYKNFSADYAKAAFADADCFCTFDGDSYSIAALLLFPQEVFIGKLQPYVRWTEVMPNGSADRDEVEVGVNYIIEGHNARVSAFWQHGDIATKGLNYSPAAAGRSIDAFRVAFQLQL
ncbi:MAG: hypothetical protein AB7Q81_08680 [Gammaproteobacteria bacterium]